MTIDFKTAEMKAARREALGLVLNTTASGCFLVEVASENLAGAPGALSTLNLILVGASCFCLVASVFHGRSVLQVVASIHQHLATSRVLIVGGVAFLCGSISGGATAWLRTSGFRLSAHFDNPASGKALYFLFVLAAILLIASALVPFLLNRRSLR
jgi:hypothetical protein